MTKVTEHHIDLIPAFKSRAGMFMLLLTVLWVTTFFEAIVSAANIWAISEIYKHCFFVMPGAFYLMWRRRYLIVSAEPKPNYWVFVPLLGFLLLGVFGFAGDIRLFTHIAAFGALPLIIWCCFGNQVAKALWFPLLFILFSIPVGDELVPMLQEVTTNLAAPLLKLSGVPFHRNGLFIDIPEGRFVVAEACSGIRFFVGSIVFGVIFAHVSYRSLVKQAGFVLLSIIVPVFANAIRVYGIIMIGHVSDMKYAVGADHLVYGWFFFSIVLFMLFLIGEWIRTQYDKDDNSLAPKSWNRDSWDQLSLFKPALMLATLLVLTMVWINVVTQPKHETEQPVFNFESLPLRTEARVQINSWEPQFKNPQFFKQANLNKPRVPRISFYYAWYDGVTEGSELVSSTNRFFDIDVWSSLGQKRVSIPYQGGHISATALLITNALGEKKIVLYWYQLPGLNTSQKIKAKLYQTAMRVLGQDPGGALVAFSASYETINDGTLKALVNAASAFEEPILNIQ